MNDSYKNSIIKVIILKLIIHLWNFLNKNPIKYAVYSNDLIIFNPIFLNLHEAHIVWLIKKLSICDYKDFFLDIGGNIGLISLAVKDEFKYLDVIEPNPECLDLLKVNLKINNEIGDLQVKTRIHELGLAEKNGEMELYIPKRNMGGGFMPGAGNSYSHKILASKDGYQCFDVINYSIKMVPVLAADVFFTNYFKRMHDNKCCKGIVKIDIEGREIQIIKSIAKTLPNNISCCIIFESWSESLDLDEILDLFSNRPRIYSYSKTISRNNKKNRAFEFLKTILRLKFKYKLYDIHAESSLKGDLMMCIDAQPTNIFD